MAGTPAGEQVSGKQRRSNVLAAAANAAQNKQARALDDLSEYEEFREMFLPAIRKALLGGASAEAILAKFKPVVAARLVQLGVAGSESAALGAIKELMDRVDGKAVQKQEHIHRLAKLPEEELNAVIESKLERLKKITIDITPGGKNEDKNKQKS